MDSKSDAEEIAIGRVEEAHQVSRFIRFRRTIMAGITVIVPVWITFLALRKIFDWADGFSVPVIQQFAASIGYPDFHIPGLGFLLTFIIIWIVGSVAANLVRKRLLQSAREPWNGCRSFARSTRRCNI